MLEESKVKDSSRTGNSVSIGGGLSFLWRLGWEKPALVRFGGGEGESVLLTAARDAPRESLEPGRRVEYLKLILEFRKSI